MNTVKVIKTADLPIELIIHIFKEINGNKVEIKTADGKVTIVTMTDPIKLTYPEDWYYSEGNLTNERTCSTGHCQEIPMLRRSGSSWKTIAKYTTYSKRN